MQLKCLGRALQVEGPSDHSECGCQGEGNVPAMTLPSQEVLRLCCSKILAYSLLYPTSLSLLGVTLCTVNRVVEAGRV